MPPPIYMLILRRLFLRLGGHLADLPRLRPGMKNLIAIAVAIAARFGGFADCPASASVPCHNRLGFLSPDFAAIDIGEVDDRRTINKSRP